MFKYLYNKPNATINWINTSKINISAVLLSGEVSISVSDNGKGIPAEKLEHLFDDSIKTDYSADKTRGMGIGLLVCRTIVNAHGGTICAKNLKTGGACFSFTLKLGGENHYY